MTTENTAPVLSNEQGDTYKPGDQGYGRIAMERGLRFDGQPIPEGATTITTQYGEAITPADPRWDDAVASGVDGPKVYEPSEDLQERLAEAEAEAEAAAPPGTTLVNGVYEPFKSRNYLGQSILPNGRVAPTSDHMQYEIGRELHQLRQEVAELKAQRR